MVQAGNDLGVGLACPKCMRGTLNLLVRYITGSALLECDTCKARFVAGLVHVR